MRPIATGFVRQVEVENYNYSGANFDWVGLNRLSPGGILFFSNC